MKLGAQLPTLVDQKYCSGSRRGMHIKDQNGSILLVQPNFLFSDMHTYFLLGYSSPARIWYHAKGHMPFQNMLSNFLLVGDLCQCSHGIFLPILFLIF